MIRRIRQVADVALVVVGDILEYAVLASARRRLGIDAAWAELAQQGDRIHKLEIEREARRQLEARNARLRVERVAS